MQGLRVAVVEALVGRLDGIDVPDEVGHAHVRGGQLLDVPLAPVHPRDGHVVSARLDEGPPLFGDGGQGVFRKRCTGQDGYPLVEQVGEAAGDPRLGLTAEAQQVHAVAREQRALHIGQDGVIVADDALEQRGAGLQPVNEVGPDFRGNGPRGVSGGAQGAEGLDVGGVLGHGGVSGHGRGGCVRSRRKSCRPGP